MCWRTLALSCPAGKRLIDQPLTGTSPSRSKVLWLALLRETNGFFISPELITCWWFFTNPSEKYESIGFIFPQSFGVKIPKSMVIWVATIDRLNRLCALSGGGTCTYLEAKFHCHPELLKLLKFLGISTHTSGVSTSFRTMIGTVRPHETIKWVQPTWQAPGRGANPSKKKRGKTVLF